MVEVQPIWNKILLYFFKFNGEHNRWVHQFMIILMKLGRNIYERTHRLSNITNVVIKFESDSHNFVMYLMLN